MTLRRTRPFTRRASVLQWRCDEGRVRCLGWDLGCLVALITERKGDPVKDVAAAGGWGDKGTLLKSYEQADAETVGQVVLHPTQRLVSR
jgi:hypothetical protein